MSYTVRDGYVLRDGAVLMPLTRRLALVRPATWGYDNVFVLRIATTTIEHLSADPRTATVSCGLCGWSAATGTDTDAVHLLVEHDLSTHGEDTATLAAVFAASHDESLYHETLAAPTRLV